MQPCCGCSLPTGVDNFWEWCDAGKSRFLFHALEDDVLRAFPETGATQFAQVLVAGDDRQEVVAGQLTHLAGEARPAVGEENFGFAESAWIEEHLAGRGMAGVVLEVDVELEVTQGNPARLAAPTRVNDLVAERQKLAEGVARPGRVFLLHARGEDERPGGDA